MVGVCRETNPRGQNDFVAAVRVEMELLRVVVDEAEPRNILRQFHLQFGVREQLELLSFGSPVIGAVVQFLAADVGESVEDWGSQLSRRSENRRSGSW